MIATRLLPSFRSARLRRGRRGPSSMPRSTNVTGQINAYRRVMLFLAKPALMSLFLTALVQLEPIQPARQLRSIRWTPS